MYDVAGWLAPAATMLAAIMTAANLGARVTGWGFVVFAVGSVCWSIVAIGTGQQNLLVTNGMLTLVNVVGIWRWLGRQARYQEGSERAARRSARARVPTLFSLSAVAGAKLVDRDGNEIGTVIDGMMRCADTGLAYVVVSEGGVSGVGERLHALHPTELVFSPDGVTCRDTAETLKTRPLLEPDDWPAVLEAPAGQPELSPR